MVVLKYKLRSIAAAVAALVAVTGWATDASQSGVAQFADGAKNLSSGVQVVDNDLNAVPNRFIVIFEEPPVAMRDSTIPQKLSKRGRQKLDMHSDAAVQYQNQLISAQAEHLNDISLTLQRNVVPVNGNDGQPMQFQHALNAVVVEMSSEEAARVRHIAGVQLVNPDLLQPLATDIGPGFIGATNVWANTTGTTMDDLFLTGFDSAPGYKGDGMVINDLDTGYNSNSPSFAATDGTGYTITNPLGTGNFLPLSQCPNNPIRSASAKPIVIPVLYPNTVGATTFAGCNDKVIGVYDYVDTTAATYSAEDFQGHGSHTGSTAGGNARTATINGFTVPISGMAPHANMVISYVCSAAGCSTAATANAVNQAVIDGVADSINFSISGGANPWTDTTSLAFLSAANAGIFVAAAGGNTSTTVPVALPGTVNHNEPWVTTVAAGYHTGGSLGFLSTVDGAGAPAPFNVKPAPGGYQISASVPSTEIKVSPNYAVSGASGDGCVAYPAGTFSGKIALVQYFGGCGTATMATNAVAAGAAVVLIANTVDVYLNSGAVQPVIPVFVTTATSAAALVAYAGGGGKTASIAYPAYRFLGAIPDETADFSLLGPNPYNLIKPDVQAPGVNIIAAFNSAVSTTVAPLGAASAAPDDGTSMATPHTAGAGALLAGMHPDWTPMEVKSALMMTAKETGLVKPNGTTASDFFDRGSGSIHVDLATKSGLVMNETGANMTAANPGKTNAATGKPGDPTSLNLASMQNSSCITSTGPNTSTNSCSFTRTVRSTQIDSVKWTASFAGNVTGSITLDGATTSTTSFTIGGHGSTQKFAINAAASGALVAGTYAFGELVLTPSNTALTTLHLPIALSVPAPTIGGNVAIVIDIPNGSTTATATLNVANTGGPTLNVTNTNFGDAVPHVYPVLNQVSQASNGFYSVYFTNAGGGAYAADDFQVYGTGVNLSKISAPGFVPSGGTALSALPTSQMIRFRIYADNAGAPAGDPEHTAVPPVWSYSAARNGAGVTVTGNTIALNLTNAAVPPTNLSTGRYWVEVNPEETTAQGGWVQFVSNSTRFGNPPRSWAGPVFTGGDSTWDLLSTDYPGFALRIEQTGTCGGAWLTAGTPTLTIGALSSTALSLSVDSTLFPSGTTASGFLCLQSNDAATPTQLVRVVAIQH